MDSAAPKQATDGAQIPRRKAIVNLSRGRTCPTTFCRELRKMAEPIDLPFGLWTWVSRRKHKCPRIRHVAPMCPYGRTHWRHLANTIEQYVCGGDAALYQITLTTCYYYAASQYYTYVNAAYCRFLLAKCHPPPLGQRITRVVNFPLI